MDEGFSSQLTQADIEKMMTFFDDSEQFDDQLIGGTTNDQMSSNIFSFDNTEYTQPVPNTPLQFSSIAIKPESHTSKRKLSDSGEHQDFMVDTTSTIGNTLFTPNIPLVVNQNVTMPTTSAFTNSRLPQLTPIPVPMTPQTPQTPQSDVFKESSSQANQQQEPSTRLLNQIQSFYISQQEQLQQIRHLQKQVLSAPQKESFEMLNNQQEQLKNQLDAELKALQELENTVILSPQELRKSFYLAQSIEAQSMQLEIYHQELQQLVMQPGQPRYFAVLAVTEQPFPMVITKGKALEDVVAVQLMTGANANITQASEVKAIVMMDNPQAKNTSSKPLDSDTERMDEFSRTAKFNFKFNHGTRKSLATIKFNLQMQIAGSQKLTLESNVSNPIVVITNECQYEESDGLLLKTDCFTNQTHITWPLFANKLQRHFLRATRQDSVKPQRFLSRYELQYINVKFFDSATVVTPKTFDEFWGWFGKHLQKLRYGRHLAGLWQSGLIYGFIERDGVNAALMSQEPGTFLLRLSERHAGSFAVGYVIDDPDPEKRVRHYLIRPEDLFGGKKSLPEFLMECAQFSKFLQVSFDFNSGHPKYRIVDKESGLEPYGVKRSNPEVPKNGYDNSLLGGGVQRN